MSRFKHVPCALLLVLAGLGAGVAQAQPAARQAALAGVGRTATPAEVKAWDIDVRPDFKGLPKGQGTVRQGEVLWEAQCASCHGSFAESSEVFTPIAGGTTAQDIKNGRVDGLMPGANQPNRTTLMKVSTLSTLWDYINRAMPWTAPKTLTPDEVYAATAYILFLGNVLPEDFTLSDANIREVQARLPNRNGMTTAHAMWPGKELGGTAKPDVQGSSCMANCKTEVVVKSFLPDYARNAHGNLAEQSRLVGQSRGVDTTRPALAAEAKSATVMAQAERAPAAATPVAAVVKTAATGSASVMPLLQKNACVACHGMDNKLVGPSFKDIANKYKDRADAVNYLSGKIKAGGQGAWGAIPMPPQALSAAESAQISQWLAQGAAK
ncbi:c-type cytochrome [Polaromonas sp. LjRoot131]|uniref:c-type cytochrome n=1 Tax=Polaromonas sp. LjRoot131 TaxID=3342262 RepID=UPI003ECF584D